jgi:hypothetical protein
LIDSFFDLSRKSHFRFAGFTNNRNNNHVNIVATNLLLHDKNKIIGETLHQKYTVYSYSSSQIQPT